MRAWWTEHRERVGNWLFFWPWLALPVVALADISPNALVVVLTVSFLAGAFICTHVPSR